MDRWGGPARFRARLRLLRRDRRAGMAMGDPSLIAPLADLARRAFDHAADW
jgi:hypothetical protein